VADSGGRDFFISYTAVNRSWAEWIAVQLEAAGYSTVLQAWDFRPGSDFIHEMQQVFAAMGPLLTELDPDRIYFNLPLAEPGQPDPMTEDLRALGERAHAVREQLSMLAAWWPTSEGTDRRSGWRWRCSTSSSATDGWSTTPAGTEIPSRPSKLPGTTTSKRDHYGRRFAGKLRQPGHHRGWAVPFSGTARPGRQR
jgi:hypothetical protein